MSPTAGLKDNETEMSVKATHRCDVCSTSTSLLVVSYKGWHHWHFSRITLLERPMHATPEDQRYNGRRKEV